MQEFSSISVSSYEPGTLADRLNEQSGDGWSVIAIVPTGSTITAYLSRDGSGSGSSSVPTPAADTATQPSPVEHVTPAAAAAPWSSDSDVADASEPDTGITVSDQAGMGATPDAIEPVDEPGGWAVSPEPASSTPAASEAAPTIPSYDQGSTSSESDATSSYGATSYDAGADNGAATAAASSAASAPAGWYADPSSRYELRYWDGSQWTEHVSRAGQQFTDPPVA
jgi:hypothetical protein